MESNETYWLCVFYHSQESCQISKQLQPKIVPFEDDYPQIFEDSSSKKTKNCTWTISHTTTVDSQKAQSPVKSAHGFALQLFCLRDTLFSNDQISCLRKKIVQKQTHRGLLSPSSNWFFFWHHWISGEENLRISLIKIIWNLKGRCFSFRRFLQNRRGDSLVQQVGKFWCNKNFPWITRQCALDSLVSLDFFPSKRLLGLLPIFCWRKLEKPKGVDSQSDFSLDKLEPLQSIRDLGTKKTWDKLEGCLLMMGERFLAKYFEAKLLSNLPKPE